MKVFTEFWVEYSVMYGSLLSINHYILFAAEGRHKIKPNVHSVKQEIIYLDDDPDCMEFNDPIGIILYNYN